MKKGMFFAGGYRLVTLMDVVCESYERWISEVKGNGPPFGTHARSETCVAWLDQQTVHTPSYSNHTPFVLKRRK